MYYKNLIVLTIRFSATITINISMILEQLLGA